MNKILLTIIALFFANTLSAATVEIEMLNRLDKESMVYSESIVNIQSGDTVKWLATTKGHNVQFVSVPEGVEKHIYSSRYLSISMHTSQKHGNDCCSDCR